MRLIVLGKPKVDPERFPQQKVVVTYDPRDEITIVNADVDIVTLGIAVNVLMDQYENYLTKLDPDVAHQIRNATRKATMYA